MSNAPSTAHKSLRAKTALFLLCHLLVLSLNAQVFEWARVFNGSSFANSTAIATDASGNVYTTGDFSGTIDFDPGAGTVNRTSAGGADIFIQKLDPSGNFLWVKTIGSTDGQSAFNMTVDASGNICIIGMFRGAVDFDPSAGVFILNAGNDLIGFVLKMDASGNFLWAKTFGTATASFGGVAPRSIKADLARNIFIAGGLAGSVSIPSGGSFINLNSAGQSDIFVCKMDSLGNFIWAKAFGGTSNDAAYSLAVDSLGNVYSTGDFNDIVDFDPGSSSTIIASEGSSDIFVHKLDSSGNFLWVRAFGSSNYDKGNSITVDNSGNIITAGNFNSNVDFNPNGVTRSFSSAGLEDAFVNKMDAAGNFIWAKAIGGNLSDHGRSITNDDSSNVYLTGTFQGTVNFNPIGGAATLSSVSSNAIFILKLTPSGNFSWVKTLNGPMNELSSAIVVDDFYNILSTGRFQGTLDFDPNSGTSFLTAMGTDDIFVHKMSQGPIDTVFSVSLPNDTLLCPSDSLRLHAFHTDSFKIEATKTFLWSTSQTDSSITITQPGTYWVEVAYDNRWKQRDSITVRYYPPYQTGLAGVDTTLCPGDSLWAQAALDTAVSHQWQHGPSKAGTWLSDSATYILQSSSYCGTWQDTLRVRYRPTLEVDTTDLSGELCPQNDSLVLELDPLVYGEYRWSNGQIGPRVVYRSPGTKNLQVISACDTLNFPFTLSEKATCDTTDIYIASAFTPNNDGLNDAFEIVNLPAQNELKIFSRWGGIVYEAAPYQNDWQGTDPSGKALSGGVFVYILRYQFNGSWQVRRGYFTLVR
jgi:gliding motility-associated-like protein